VISQEKDQNPEPVEILQEEDLIPEPVLTLDPAGKGHKDDFLLHNDSTKGTPQDKDIIVPQAYIGICDICCKTFTNRRYLQRHINNVHTTGDFSCQFCSKKYEKKYSLQEHLRTTHENDESACEFCSKIFKNGRYLRGHVRDVHGNSGHSVCDQCKNTFENKNSLKSHIREVHRNDWISCNACGKIYKSKSTLEKHSQTSCPGSKRENGCMKNLIKEENGLCNQCLKSFKNLKAHKLSVHSTKDILYPCKHCNKEFVTNGRRDLHINTVHEVNQVSCDSCRKVCKNKMTLRKHVQKAHRVNQVSCEICKKVYHKYLLKRHIRRMHKTKSWVQETKTGVQKSKSRVQKKETKVKNILIKENIREENLHADSLKYNHVADIDGSNRKSYKQEIVEIINSVKFQDAALGKDNKESSTLDFIKREEALPVEIMLAIDPQSKAVDFQKNTEILNCILCDEPFSTLALLRKHTTKCFNRINSKSTQMNKSESLLSHEIDGFSSKSLKKTNVPRMKSHACSLCDYTTTRSDHLRMHQEYKHKGVKYSCDQCEFQGTRPSTVKRHKESIHEGLRYSCVDCEYQGTTPSNLKCHRESRHEGVRYSCNQCDHLYKTLPHLRAHKRSKHEGISYSCDKCEYQTTRQSTLKIHHESKHIGITYPCDSCEYSSSCSRSLRRHKKSKHQD